MKALRKPLEYFLLFSIWKKETHFLVCMRTLCIIITILEAFKSKQNEYCSVGIGFFQEAEMWRQTWVLGNKTKQVLGWCWEGNNFKLFVSWQVNLSLLLSLFLLLLFYSLPLPFPVLLLLPRWRLHTTLAMALAHLVMCKDSRTIHQAVLHDRVEPIAQWDLSPFSHIGCTCSPGVTFFIEAQAM